MASQSFYRKWRSQSFAEVVGQSHVTRTLRNALQMGRVAHAYLLCGPRGVGKTSVARILAKGINCLDPRDGEPCNNCSMCEAITQGRALDVVEVDAASNRRIEEMRDLRDKVSFAPSEARYKVYILDEAHMLTHEASNALLKTLEEPPARTVFVLVTTESHRIPETIVSRCQRFNFRRIGTAEIVEQLQLICVQEELQVAPEALTLVARTATGSLRDAEGLLDQLVAYCGSEITLAQVRAILGLSADDAIQRLAECALGGDIAGGIALINEVADAGGDLRRYGEDVVSFLRGALVLKSGASAALLRDSGPEVVEQMRACAGRTTLDHLVHTIRVFSDIEQGPRGGPALALPLELALTDAVLHLEKAAAPEMPPSPQLRPLQRPVSPPPTQRASPVPPPASPEPAATRPAPSTTAAPPEPAKPQPPVVPAPSLIAEPDGHEQVAKPPIKERVGGDTSLDDLRQRWGDVIEVVGQTNKLLQAVLRDCGPFEVRDGHLIIGCDAPFHQDRLSQKQHKDLLEKAIAEVTAARLPLQFAVVPRQKRGQAPSATSDPLVKELLSWGGRIKAVIPESEKPGDPRSPAGDEEVKQ